MNTPAMKKRSRTTLAIVIVSILGGLAQPTLLAREPSYQGKRLSDWMNDFEADKPEVRQEARDAIRKIGTNALPLIIEFIRSTNSPAKLRLMEWSKRQSMIHFHFTKAYEQHRKAFQACDALGPAAQSAIPALCERLYWPQPDSDALFLIGRIGGSNAVLSSVQNLTNSSKFLRLSTAVLLELIRTSPTFFNPDETALPLPSEGWYYHRLVRYNALVLHAAAREVDGTLQDFPKPLPFSTNNSSPTPASTQYPPPGHFDSPPPIFDHELGPGLAPFKNAEQVTAKDIAQ